MSICKEGEKFFFFLERMFFFLLFFFFIVLYIHVYIFSYILNSLFKVILPLVKIIPLTAYLNTTIKKKKVILRFNYLSRDFPYPNFAAGPPFS